MRDLHKVAPIEIEPDDIKSNASTTPQTSDGVHIVSNLSLLNATPPRNVVNIASHLSRMALERPYAMAVMTPAGRDRRKRTRYVHFSYKELDAQSSLIARGLLASGIEPDSRAVLMVQPGLDFFALVFAMFKARIALVCIDPGMGIKNLGTCLAEAAPSVFIGNRKAHTARRVLRWAHQTLQKNILVTDGRQKIARNNLTLESIRRLGADASDLPLPQCRSNDTAAILFTSGSTGIAKGVVYTHGHFTAQLTALGSAYHIQPGEVDLATFPLFALYAPALGLSAIVPEMDFTQPGKADPKKIIQTIEQFGVTNFFGSPAMLDRVGRYAQLHGIRLPSLKRVVCAGAAVPATVLERIAEMLHGDAQVFTPYGATEALPVASIGSREILFETRKLTDQGKGVCVGRPVGEMRIRLITINDEPIDSWSDDRLVPDGQVGEIVVQGPVVTGSYFGQPASTALAKISDSSGGVCHRMGDLGYFDRQGRLWFCGRKSQRVSTAKGDMYTIVCEAIFNTHPAVRRSALVGLGAKGHATPVICVELEHRPTRTERNAIRRELLEIAARHEKTSQIQTVLFHKSLPVDRRHNAKINREWLTLWANRRCR